MGDSPVGGWGRCRPVRDNSALERAGMAGRCGVSTPTSAVLPGEAKKRRHWCLLVVAAT